LRGWGSSDWPANAMYQAIRKIGTSETKCKLLKKELKQLIDLELKREIQLIQNQNTKFKINKK
jgi:hypothetical protein